LVLFLMASTNAFWTKARHKARTKIGQQNEKTCFRMDRHQGQRNYMIQICCTGDGFVEGATWNNATLNSGTNNPREPPKIYFNRLLIWRFQNKAIQFFGPTWYCAQRKKWHDWKVKKTNAAIVELRGLSGFL
jgi:hypothetical protein